MCRDRAVVWCAEGRGFSWFNSEFGAAANPGQRVIKKGSGSGGGGDDGSGGGESWYDAK